MCCSSRSFQGGLLPWQKVMQRSTFYSKPIGSQKFLRYCQMHQRSASFIRNSGCYLSQFFQMPFDVHEAKALRNTTVLRPVMNRLAQINSLVRAKGQHIFYQIFVIPLQKHSIFLYAHLIFAGTLAKAFLKSKSTDIYCKSICAVLLY